MKEKLTSKEMQHLEALKEETQAVLKEHFNGDLHKMYETADCINYFSLYRFLSGEIKNPPWKTIIRLEKFLKRMRRKRKSA